MESLSNTRGSALLISILLMSFVIVFGLGISSLIVDSVRVERNVIEAGKAYFAAEGGVEEALYYHENKLPGYEGLVEEYELLNGALMSYEMLAAQSTVPCHGASARVLTAQESVSWPLFKWDADDGRYDLTSFTVTYDIPDNAFAESDVFRWKILGLDADDSYTEAVSGLLDFDPMSSDNVLDSSDDGNHYDLDSAPVYTNYSTYSISQFLGEHILNYLVLSNLSDSDMEVQLTSSEEAACEYTLIEADGESGGAVQSIDVLVKLDSFLPVFDFVLYQTE